MTISYPLSLPSAPTWPSAVKLLMNDIVGVSTSGFTAQQEVQRYQGQFWSLQISLPLMVRKDAEPWLAFLAALRGQYGTFLAGDLLGATPRGLATGTPVTNGAQTARQSSLDITGWTASKTGILKAGDYLQITGTKQRLYKVLADADSDASGDCTVDVWPDLREAYDDATSIVTASAKGLFRLNSNQRSWDQQTGGYYNVSFQAIEAQ